MKIKLPSQNVFLLIPLAILTACSPQNVEVAAILVEKHYPQSEFLIAESVRDKVHEPEIHSFKNFTVGKVKTVYANQAVLTVSNEKEQKISLPYVVPGKSVKIAYEEPKTFKELQQGTKTNKVKFVEFDRNIIYPLQILKEVPAEYYLPQSRAESAGAGEILENSSETVEPRHYVLAGDVYVGITEKGLLDTRHCLRSNLEMIAIDLNTEKLDITFKQLTTTKKSALSENNYSLVYLGKKGNTLQFRKIYNHSDKASEYAEVKMNSPQIEVFGHKIFVQTATREALYCIIQK